MRADLLAADRIAARRELAALEEMFRSIARRRMICRERVDIEGIATCDQELEAAFERRAGLVARIVSPE
jgi:ribosomal protein L20A (L18A)